MPHAVQGAAGLARLPSSAAQAAPVITSPGHLLPDASSTFDVSGALTELLKLGSEITEQQSQTAMNSAGSSAEMRKEASDKRTKALNDAIEAARKAAEERDSGGFFDSITKNLGPVGLVGLCVGSVYIVAADLAAHAIGLEDNKMDLGDAGGLGAMAAGPLGVAAYAAQLCVKKFGPDDIQQALDNGPTVKDDDVRTANKIALIATQAELALAATVVTGGTTAPAVVAMVGIGISTATQLSEASGATKAAFGENAQWVTLGGSLVGAALTLVGGVGMLAGVGAAGASAATTSSGVAAQSAGNGGAVAAQSEEDGVGIAAQAAENGVGVAKAAHDINQGVHNLRAAAYQHDADNYRIDAKQQKHVLEFVDRMIDAVISDMKHLKESAQKTTELLQGALQTQSQTMLIASSMKG